MGSSFRSDPLVSVVLTAYGRLAYLGAALTSALQQNVPSEDFEIVLVSNLPQVKDIVSRSVESSHSPHPEVRVVLSFEEVKGRFFGAGVRAARGAVLCFLNDDDVWHHDKLQYVIREFSDGHDTVYLHHAMEYIDDSGARADQLAGHRRLGWLSCSKDRYYPDSRAALRDPLVGVYEPGNNDSCIAIRRPAVIKSIDFMERILAGEDLFLFYSALVFGGAIRLSSRRLTKYRVHSLGSSIPGAGRQLSQFLPELTRESQKREVTFAVIREMVAESGDARLIRWANREVTNLELLRVLQSPQFQKRDVLERALRLIPFVMDYNVPLNCSMLALSTLAMASRGLGSRMYSAVHG